MKCIVETFFKTTITFLFIFHIAFAADSCEQQLSETPVLNDLRKLKIALLSAKDRTERLFLEKDFDQKISDLSAKTGVTTSVLLERISTLDTSTDLNRETRTNLSTQSAAKSAEDLFLSQFDPDVVALIKADPSSKELIQELQENFYEKTDKEYLDYKYVINAKVTLISKRNKSLKDPEIFNKYVRFCLYFAIQNQDSTLAKLAIMSGVDVNTGSIPTEPGIYIQSTFLFVAIQYNAPEIIKLLLENGANPNHSLKIGILYHGTYLFHSNILNNVELVEAFINHGADPQKQDSEFSRPLTKYLENSIRIMNRSVVPNTKVIELFLGAYDKNDSSYKDDVQLLARAGRELQRQDLTDLAVAHGYKDIFASFVQKKSPPPPAKSGFFNTIKSWFFKKEPENN